MINKLFAGCHSELPTIDDATTDLMAGYAGQIFSQALSVNVFGRDMSIFSDKICQYFRTQFMVKTPPGPVQIQ